MQHLPLQSAAMWSVCSKSCCPCVSVNCTEESESPRHHMVTIKCQEQGLAVAKIASGLTLSDSDSPWSAVSPPLIATLQWLHKVYGTPDNIRSKECIIANNYNLINIHEMTSCFKSIDTVLKGDMLS